MAFRSSSSSVGNIPAHAGKTLGVRPPTAPPLGTSPRTRGKRPRSSRHCSGTGNIPAHAGKTAAAFLNPSPAAEHPRARGENAGVQLENLLIPGTSPRTRGKLALLQKLVQHIRNIPAHAGKTVGLTIWRSMNQEHPRARGENSSQVDHRNDPKGTSPRTRGKQGVDWRQSHTEGNIPAHAGKTPAVYPTEIASMEHPRARGENPPPQ